MQTNGYIKERMIAAAQNITEKDYWINKLSGRPIKTTFPYDHMRSVQGDDQMDRVIFSIKNDLFSRLMKISNQSDVRLYTILVTALTLLLEKYTENEDIIVGIPTYKQKVEGIPINTILPLRNHVNPEQTFKELLLQVGQTIFDANQHQNYPIEILIYKLGMHFDGHHCPLFDIAILFEGLHNREYLGPFYLNTIFSFSSVQGAIKGLLEYNTRYYKKETIEQIIEHFTHLLKEALFNVDAATSSISLLSEEEKRHLIVDFNNTRHEFSIRQSIYHLIEEYAESKPDLNALIFEGSSWTYHHLNEESNKLAWTLKNRGVRENQTVGILLERSPWMVASILAVWKSNGAYIPIDTRYPVARTVDILEDACACVLITCADYLEPQLEKSFKGAVVQLDVAQPEAISVSVTSENLNLLFNINSLAYVIFTSGSTGKPKGAMVEHIGMMNHIQAKINDLQLTENSVVAQNASHTFDISVWQLFAGLAVGGKIVIYPNELILEPGQFFTRLIEDHVTILEVVPSYLSVMLDVIEDRGGGLAIDFPLDYLLVTGEEIKLFLVRKWFSIYPGIKMVNAYGPTEASDDITHFIMDKAPTGERIPIGKPLQNLNIYIVDRRMNLCPVGVPGEILVSGVGVGRGYIGDSARTAEVFTVDPFRQEEGGRLYKTGDIGRWLPDGNIEFLGRKDYQVKIRGFRIELGEIENQLVRHPLVKDAIVVERSKENNDKYLCAYIVKDTHPGATVNEHELREMLSFELPDYMIPDYFIELERFPLTPTGKCDRAALPEPCRTGLADIPYISDERLNQLKNQLEKESTGSKGGAEAHLDDAVHQAEVLKKFSNESGVLYYPLSHPQKMIYYSEKKYPNTGNANAVYLVRYSKILDQELLQKAVNIVLFKNQNLRLRVMEIEKDDDFFPAQYVAPYKEHALEKFDFSYERNQVLSTQLKEWVEKCSAKPFKLIDSDLFYFAYLIFNKKESGYFMNIHHVITDQWSCFLISVEINKIYHALESGREIGDSQVVSYFQYLRDEMDYLNSPRAAEDRKFWLNYLLPLPTEVNLSPIQSDGDRNDLEAKVHYSVFPFDLRSRMHRYCREHKTTLYKLILSALSIYISRTAGVNDFVVGTLNHNRSTPVHKEIVGTFISFVPIRVKVSQEKIFQDFVKEKGESINYVIKNHQRYPFDMLVAEIRERTAGDVDYFFNINLIGHPDLEEKDFKIKRLFQGYEMTPLTIHVNRSNKDIDGILELEWIFQVAKFSENDMKRIHNGLVNILENALNEPNKKISKLEMVSDREKKFILEDLGCREHSLPMHIIQSVMPELNEGRCFYTYILSPEGMVQPPGVPGELCLAFIDVEHRSTGNIRRTGQLARWLENEKIELLGDIHRQIWVDGRRLDAGRIESCLLSHKNVTQTVVVSRGGMGNKQLCAYIVLNGPVGKSRLVEYLTEKLPKHLIPEDIVQLQCFPLRSNGTIDIELLESLTIDTVFSKGIRPPRNETEWKMVDIWSWLLGIEKEQIGIGDNFFEIGGHSLKAIQLVTKIHKELNVRIPMAKIFEFPTIESLAEHIREIENEKFTAIEPAEKKNYYRLSSAQKRFYFLRQVDKTGTSYNMPRVITVEGELDRQWITDTFKLMIQRHESLRTSFHLVDENIFQRVHDEVEFEPEYFDLEAVGGDSISEQEVAAGIIQKFIKPFELSRAPLMRVGFVKVKEKRHLLMLDTHHIISDGVSTAIFLKEFKAFYSGEYLQPLRIQYRDYAEWQHNEKKKEEFMKQEAFWCSQFKGNIPVLNLPTDYRRPSEQNFEGKHVDFEIGMNETQAFNRLVLQEDVTLFMLFLAIYNVLLLKLSGQEDIVVGAPIAGRSHADLEQIIGIFVNTLVLRNFPSGEKTFIEFLHEVKEKTLSAFENQDYQYEDLVDQVVISRDANRNPLFDTMFVLQNIDIAEINIPGLKLKPYQYKNEVSKFDLALSGVEEADKLIFTFEYSTKLFREGTINRFIVYFKNIVTEVIEDKYKRISNFGIITVEEKKRILFDFNNTRANYPKNKTIHRLFEEQVERTPDHIAIFGHGRTRTITSYNLPMAIAYQELNEQSNRMACLLIEKGVLSDNIVGIMMERSCEMVISIYGILKAGGAYLPIDPDYPQERINYMMWDSGAKLLVTTNDKESEKMRRWEGEKVLLEKNSHFQKSASCPLNFLPSYSENSSYLAYVIYTSGTTGQSKGALIEHRNVVRLLFNDKFQFHFTNYDIWTLFHSFCFDFSVWEMYGALLYGGKLVIVPKMVARDTTEFLELLNRETVTVLNQTPSAFYNLINEVLSPHQQGKKLCIKYVIFGGEALNTLKLRNWLEKYPQTSLINMFGITETTVHVTYKELNEKDVELSISNIGKPIPTMNAYILDRYLEPVPIGVAGEIYVGGDGVARGYLNRVELTIGKFIKNPLKLGDRLYRSGDTGRYLENGDIEYLGRIDKQVKIRGFRIELGEIENELLKHDDINEAVVVAWESGELSNYLCAYIVCQSKIDKSELREYIGKQLPDYMIPSYFVHLDKIPLTPNGKVDYNALVANKENVMEDNKECIPPQNVVEKKLVDIWKKVLGREEVGINQNFFTIGGDSIKSIQIISRMRSAGYKLEMKDIFQYPVILNLAPRVKKLKRIPEQSIITGTIPLTPIQKAFFNESHIEAYHYNQAVMLYSREGFDKETIKKVFFRIQEHHDALRMIYKKYEVGGHVIQVNHGLEYPLYLEEQNLKNCENSLEELKTNANRIQASINLEKGPLMKLGLFHLNDGDRLLIVIHHLVIDGVSWRILLEDIETLYSQNKRGEKLLLPSKTDSFKFWSDKLLAYANSKIFLKQKTYWQKIESIDAPSSTIPKDFNVDDNYIKDTGSVSFTLRVEETELLFTKVNQIFKTEINDILLTALGISIKKTFGQDLVLVDMEGHGREEILEDMDIGRTVGWFTSVYPVLMDISYAGDTGRQIKEIKETLRRIPNKGIGYGILKYLTNEENKEKIEFKLKPQICFNYLGQVDADVKQLSSFEMAKESTGNLLSLNNRRIYLLNISGLAVNNRLTINISFNKTHFKPETMASLIGNLESELTHIIAFCSSRESIERTPSDFTYSELTIERLQCLLEVYPDVEDIYTLSPLQEGMLFYSLIDRSSYSYFEQITFRFQGELVIPLMEKSYNELINRHDILRTAFIHKDTVRPMQLVLKSRLVDFHYEDISKSGGEKEKDFFIKEYKEKDKQRSFDLSKDVLMRVAVFRLSCAEYQVIWSHHHILMDGWCIGILSTEFFEIYTSWLDNKPYRLPEVKPYRMYIQWLEKQDKEESARYWQNYLDSFEEPVGVPKTKILKEGSGYRNEAVSIVLDMEKTARLNILARSNHVTLNIIIQVIWGILLGKYNIKKDVVFGAVVSGRPSELAGVESMVGLFINTIPVRIKFEENIKFNQLLQIVQKESLDSEPYHYHPLAEIQAGTALKQNLIDHIMTFENYPIAEQIEGYGKEKNRSIKTLLKLSSIEVFEQTNYDFNIILSGSDRLKIILRYNGNVYEEDFLMRIFKHFSLVFDQVIENQELVVKELTLLSVEEKHQLIYEFNDTGTEYFTTEKTLQQKLNESLSSDRLKDCNAIECGKKSLTYNELDIRSSQVANWIIEKSIPGETFIGILVVDRIEFIIITIGILKVRCVFIPLEPTLPMERLKLMIHSTDTKFVIGDKVNFDRLFSDNLNDKLSSEVEFISVDTCLTNINSSRSVGNIDIDYNAEDKIYVYFTSGTTGEPRAFVGKNKSLLHFINWEIDTFGINGYFRISQLINPGFDAFLRDVFVPLCTGGVICIPECNEILLSPVKLVKWLERSRINLIHCVPSLFRTFNSNDLTQNYFKDLKFILLSGEKIEPSHLIDWYKTFDDRIQLVNLWGTSETTLAKTCYFIKKSDIIKERMPVGKPIKGARVLVLNEDMDICEDMTVGEVYIRTPYRTFGYYNDPGLNKLRFIINPFNNDTDDLLHKTGDLGRLLPDGNLEILGRADRQIKIRGIRIELEEIESILLGHPGVKEVAVIKKDLPNHNELLYAYITCNTKDDTGEDALESILKKYLSKRLPDYMVPSRIFSLKEIPRTPNRKIDYKKLSDGFKEENSYTPPRNKLEKRILELWSNILGIEKTKISVTRHFFELGGNSLNIMSLIAKIHKEFDIRIPLGDIFINPTIERQAVILSQIQKDNDTKYMPIVMTEKKEYYSLSYSQKRIYTAIQLELASTSYNMPVIFRLIGELDIDHMQNTFWKLIERHESLRTSFEIIGNEPVQRVHDKIKFAIQYLGSGEGIAALRSHIRAFDLTQAPLLRVYLSRTGDREYGMMMDISHLISDGVSSMLMAKDLMKLYNKQELPHLNIHYKDFAEWESQLFQTGNIKKLEDFWFDAFSGDLPVLELPTDFPRPEVRNVDAGDTISCILKESPKQKLDEIIMKTGSTLFILLLAIYNVLLNKYSGQEDIVVGSVVTGRKHEDLENVIGVFVNMLPLRNRPQPGKRFRDFLEEVKENALHAFDNQDYPVEELVKKLQIRSIPGKHPLFDTEFAVNNIEFEEIVIPGLKMENYASGINFAKFDLHFLAIEHNHSLHIILRYATELFKKTTAETILNNYIEIIEQVVENLEIKLEEITVDLNCLGVESKILDEAKGDFGL